MHRLSPLAHFVDLAFLISRQKCACVAHEMEVLVRGRQHLSFEQICSGLRRFGLNCPYVCPAVELELNVQTLRMFRLGLFLTQTMPYHGSSKFIGFFVKIGILHNFHIEFTENLSKFYQNYIRKCVIFI